jgi:hypothetical protein
MRGGGNGRKVVTRDFRSFKAFVANAGSAHKYKKRPKLFSLGRLGSPPPELPNYETDTRWGLVECKRHFGNPYRSDQ